MKRLGLLVLIGYTVSTGVAHAATYYVAQNGGSNTNTCTQATQVNAQGVPTAPKQTINAGLACLKGGGDTLLIRGGNYDETMVDAIPSGTSWSNYVRVANYKGETVMLVPSTNTPSNVIRLGLTQQFIEIDGIGVNGTKTDGHAILFGLNVRDIRYKNAFIQGRTSSSGTVPSCVMVIMTRGEFTNLRCTGDHAEYLFYVQGDQNIIDGNEADGVAFGGIHIYSGSRVPTGNIIRNNRIHNILTSFFFGKPDGRALGILISGNNNEVYNNLIYGIDIPGTTGTDGRQGAIPVSGSGNKIWNNTIANNRAFGIKTDQGASNTEVRNNIAYGNTGSAFTNSGSGTTESNNLFGVDPQFVNPSGNDFKLKSDSRGVDAGVTVSAVTNDLAGIARPQGRIYDIGAYEFSGQPTASGPPAPPTGVRIVSN